LVKIPRLTPQAKCYRHSVAAKTSVVDLNTDELDP
jgi:hypothetical protein